MSLVGDPHAEAGDLCIHDLVPFAFPGLLQTGDQGRGEVLPVVCLRHGRGHLGATRMRNAMRPNERVRIGMVGGSLANLSAYAADWNVLQRNELVIQLTLKSAGPRFEPWCAHQKTPTDQRDAEQGR